MKLLPVSAAGVLLAACSPTIPSLDIAGPAPSVRRAETLQIADVYARLDWQPQARHVLHGPDAAGVRVHTPDRSLAQHGFSNGWWSPGAPARGMPYQWGGFDTPREFLASLERGEVAGDISTAEKRRLGDAGTSRAACGIDCSGFVSRCWRLARPTSTAELPRICDPLPRWEDLKAGDIVLNDRHVLLFARWAKAGEGLFYEAGPKPVWRVNAAGIPVASLKARGYAPWRYRKIVD